MTPVGSVSRLQASLFSKVDTAAGYVQKYVRSHRFLSSQLGLKTRPLISWVTGKSARKQVNKYELIDYQEI